jgi:hypothetical protein
MTPMPVKPTVVVLVDENGNPIKHASNIPELTVITVVDPKAFEAFAQGRPYTN